MKVLAVIVNIFVPGIGSIIVGKVGTGIVQFLLYLLGVALTATLVLVIVGAPLMFIVWVWAIVTAASHKPEPLQVEVVHRYEAPPPDDDR